MRKMSRRSKENGKWRKLIILGIVGLPLGYLLWLWAENSVQIRSIEFQPGDSVPHNRVCMVKNQILEKLADSIMVDGSTYFGCCVKCLFKLEHNIENVRMAVDPTTMGYVDKSQAFITPIYKYHKQVVYYRNSRNSRSFSP